MLNGSGFFAPPSWAETLLGGLMIIFLASNKWTFRLLLLPITLGYALYTPIGLTFGKPTYQYLASVFATDLLESREFLSQLPLLNVAAGVAILGAVIFYRKIVERQQIKPLKNKLFLLASGTFMLFQLAPSHFFQQFYAESMKVKKELETLNNLTIASNWGTSTLSDSKYDDYVLIIGESARKDYHHAYGYPSPNTPFMSSANGTLINGFTAGGTNTIASLKLMLTKPNTEKWEGDYSRSLIDLVKSAGIKTFWLSNQGYLGTYDTPISSLANKSDEKFFTKAGDSLNQNISDFELLSPLEKVLSQPATGKRFIVLHLYGSHPISCDRLEDYPKMYDDEQLPKKYHNVNCYVSSIKKTDELLKRVYELLSKNSANSHRLFSMIYFSDHGLSHLISEDNITIHNSSGKSKLHFDVPLFKISSDDTKRQEFNVFKSGLNFTDGIAHWLGIQNPQLNPNADLFSNQSDPDDYGLKKIIDEIDAPLDPAVPIPEAFQPVESKQVEPK